MSPERKAELRELLMLTKAIYNDEVDEIFDALDASEVAYASAITAADVIAQQNQELSARVEQLENGLKWVRAELGGGHPLSADDWAREALETK